jgi:hypothetical protein
VFEITFLGWQSDTFSFKKLGIFATFLESTGTQKEMHWKKLKNLEIFYFLGLKVWENSGSICFHIPF